MRGKGEGSVSRAPDGSGWIARVELPAVDGKRQRMKRRARTRAEAVKKLKEMQTELDQGGMTDRRRTVGKAIDTYLAVRRRDGITDGAMQDIEWACATVRTHLGHKRLADLRVVDVDRFLANCADGKGKQRPIGRDRLRRLRRALHRVLDNEVRSERLSRNVAAVAAPPKSVTAPDEPRALDAQELRDLLDAATGSRLVLIDLCGRNGLRPAEARALRWADIDLDAYEIRIRAQQNRNNTRTNVKRAHNAARTILTDETTIARLKAWQAEQADLQDTAGEVWEDQDLVASTKVGTPVDRHSFARSMRLLCRKLDITPPVTPYELRHTAISHQADAGRSAWEIADWAGTSEAMISRIYRHRLRRVAPLTPIRDSLL